MNISEKQRTAIKAFMAENNLTPYSWAKKAGIATSVIPNFLSGGSNSLSSITLEKLATSVNSSPGKIIGGKAPEEFKLNSLDEINKPNFTLDEDVIFKVQDLVSERLKTNDLKIPAQEFGTQVRRLTKITIERMKKVEEDYPTASLIDHIIELDKAGKL